MSRDATDTNQSGLKRDSKGRITGGTPPAGFNKHPENRSNGSWRKELTPRYKLERMMTMAESELKAIVEDENMPLFDQKLATAIKRGQWKEIEGMINQVYGSPKQQLEHKVEAGPSLAETIKTAIASLNIDKSKL